MKAFYDPRMNIEGTGDSAIFVKARLFRETVSASGIKLDWCPVSPTSWSDWRGVHDPQYLDRIVRSPEEVLASASLPLAPDSMEAQHWNAGSMLAACTASLADGIAMSPSGAFHHAHYAGTGAFCVLNALVLCAQRLIAAGVRRILILDCDFHRGNGTADILQRLVDDRIDHISLGQLYCRKSQAADYMRTMTTIARDISARAYECVIYQAGMDVLLGDPSGGGILSYRQAYVRDEMVFAACRESRTPVAWNYAGGYKTDGAGELTPALAGHLNTVLAACKVFERLEDDVVTKLARL